MLAKKETFKCRGGWWLVFLLQSCTHYQAQPLTEAIVQQQLDTPGSGQLIIHAAKIKHPLLESLSFNLQDGFSPDEAAILAVLRNPDLRALRTQRGIANAQVLQAGLLPDPQLSYGLTAPSGGTDFGMNNAFGLSLSWEASALIWQDDKIKAAQKNQQAIDLQIAWQEWQYAQVAKLAVYQLWIYRQQQRLLNEMAQRLEDNCIRLQQAADLGLVTELQRVAGVSAKNGVDIRLLALEQQVKQQQQRLNRAVGIKPHETFLLQQDIVLLSELRVADYAVLIEGLERQRLDLMALKYAYESQDEQLHVAALQQFPQMSIGFDHARDNSNLYTVGFGISMTLPIFDRNQGQIAIEYATRQQLYEQYIARVFQARADIAELLVTIVSLNQQVKSVRYAIPDLIQLVNAYQLAMQSGQVDVLNYYDAWNSLTDKKIDLLGLQLQLKQAEIALQVASGLYRVSADF